MRSSLAISISLSLHEAIVCPQRIWPSIDYAFCFQRNGDTQVPARRSLRAKASTVSVNQETRKVGAAISHSAFPVRKTFNQRGLQFRFPSYLVGDRVASFGCATKSAVVDCDCCHQPLVGS